MKKSPIPRSTKVRVEKMAGLTGLTYLAMDSMFNWKYKALNTTILRLRCHVLTILKANLYSSKILSEIFVLLTWQL